MVRRQASRRGISLPLVTPSPHGRIAASRVQPTMNCTSQADARKICFFRRNILLWFQTEGRSFPWRDDFCDSYRVVVGEILLQRTTAERVSSFFPTFVRAYPSWHTLASATQQDLQSLVQPLGLWRQRATRLLSLAGTVAALGGELPQSRDGLEALPGVGQYTSNAVLTICHNAREPLLDVNMARLLERFFGLRKLVDIRYDTYLQDLSRAVLSRGSAKKLNWAMLDFAALVCKARNPSHASCPLSSRCRLLISS